MTKLIENAMVVVPARGGSRRLKRKVMCEILGRPLIWYTLDCVRRAGLACRTMVVTDDDEIAAYVSEEPSVPNVPVFREPPVGADDESAARAIHRAVRHQVEKGQAFVPEVIVSLQPTNPVRSLDLVQRCVDALVPEVDAVRSVLPARMHPEWCLRLGEHERICPRGTWDISQSYEQAYELSGCVDVFWARVFSDEPRSPREFWSGVSCRAVVHDDVHCDVDTRRDLLWFEFLLRGGYTMWGMVK